MSSTNHESTSLIIPVACRTLARFSVIKCKITNLNWCFQSVEKILKILQATICSTALRCRVCASSNFGNVAVTQCRHKKRPTKKSNEMLHDFHFTTKKLWFTCLQVASSCVVFLSFPLYTLRLLFNFPFLCYDMLLRDLYHRERIFYGIFEGT